MRYAIVLLVAVVVSLGAVAIVTASGDPQVPSWVDQATGVVDPSAFPDEIGVDGPDGQPIKCNGKELKVKRADLLAKPPPPAASHRSDERMYAPRCGAGGRPEWVPVG